MIMFGTGKLCVPSKVTPASGRKRPLIFVIFQGSERLLSAKADVQILVFEKSLRNDRYTLNSGRWADTIATGRY